MFGRRYVGPFVACGLSIVLAGCNDPDERKTHYITIYTSQDVEIKEVLIDLDMKKPGVVVEHPEGVEVKPRPTKPRKTVSFDALPAGLLALFLFLLLPFLRREQRQPELTFGPAGAQAL